MKTETAIIIPPFYSPFYPQFGPVILKGYVRKHGLDFTLIDMNLDFRSHLMEKIKLTTVVNPDNQQNPYDVELILMQYFTDNMVRDVFKNIAYLSDMPGLDQFASEQFNPEVGAGLGYASIVTSRPDIVASFVRDKKNNYYHQYLDESGYIQKVAHYKRIGFSLNSQTQVIPAFTLALRLKEIRPEIEIMLGGPWVTMFADELTSYTPLFDFYDLLVEGEGEEPVRDILKSKNSSEYPDIANVWYRCGNSFKRSENFFQADLRDIPAPDYDGLDLDRYTAPRPVLIQGTRGCYWGRCAFCVHACGPKDSRAKAMRTRPFDLFISDIDTLIQKYSPRFIAFVDVAISPNRMKRLCQAMMKRKYKIPWFAFLRFEEGFDLELLRMMHFAGCVLVNYGLESASEKVLERIEKGHNLETVRRIISDTVKWGTSVTLHTMAGLPGETKEELEKTIKLIQEYMPILYESYTEIFRLEKHTKIYYDPEKYGIIKQNSQRIFDNAIPFKNINGLSTEEAAEILDKSINLFFKENEKTILYLGKDQSSIKAKDSFKNPSVFKAAFSARLPEGEFNDEITVSTTGGRILHIEKQ